MRNKDKGNSLAHTRNGRQSGTLEISSIGIPICKGREYRRQELMLAAFSAKRGPCVAWLPDRGSRPVMPNDEEYQYLPTQAVAEYLAEKADPRLDGLIFPSSQQGGVGKNVVLFRHASAVGKETIPYDVELSTMDWPFEGDEDLDITVWQKKKREAATKAEKPRLLFFEDTWPDLLPGIDEPTTLRLAVDEIEVRYIRAVEYKTRARRVTRYTEPEGGFPF